MQTEQTAQIAHNIHLRIAQLEELSGTDLKKEMDDLKMVLLQNENAAELLLPEDIGLAVRAIKRIVYAAKISIEKPVRKGSQKVDLLDIIDE